MKRKDLVELIERTISVISQINQIAEEAGEDAADPEIKGYYQGVRDQALLSEAAFSHVQGVVARSEIEE
jgi:hypothetical protein